MTLVDRWLVGWIVFFHDVWMLCLLVHMWVQPLLRS